MATNYSGNSTPTLNNAPASSWTDDAAKRSHVGNTYLVTGSGGTAGNVYAFEEYPTPLIKNASGLPADIVTITDGGENKAMTKAEVSLSPIQSLNGYDHPWAGGAGKNKYPTAIGAESFANNGGATHSNSDGTLVIVCDSSSTSSGVYGGAAGYLHQTAVAIGYPCTISFEIWGTATGQAYLAWENSGQGNYDISTTHRRVSITASSQASAAYFNAYGRNYNGTIYIKDVQIEAGSTPTAFAPYENICPITGHDSATLNRTGKNLLPPFSGGWINGNTSSWMCKKLSNTPPTFPFTFLRTGAAAYNNVPVYVFSCKPNTVYTITPPNANLMPVVSEYARIEDVEDTSLAVAHWQDYDVHPKGVVTKRTSENANYLVIGFSNWVGTSDITVTADAQMQLELGSTATAYTPYVGTSYPVSFPQTVYGGTFDWVSGKLVVTHELKNLKNSNPSYIGTYDTGGKHGVYINYVLNVKGTYLDGLCNMAPVSQTSSYDSNQYMILGVNSRYLYWVGILDALNLDINGFKTWLAANDVYVTVPLATPVEIDLTPTEVQTLLGKNVVWADNGQISELQYRSNQFTPAWQWFETWTMPKITRDNGTVIVLPYPQEYTPEIYDVDAATTGRNAAGTMIRDRVARKHKFNYKFPPLSQADATEILGAVQDVSFTLTTASPETGAKTNYRVYVGDRSLPVYWMPTHDNASWLYSSLSLNLIEM